MEAVTIA
jgi:hypothetical protein